MKFSIITPSYKQLPWLRLCIHSVEDQVEGKGFPASAGKFDGPVPSFSVEHIIQDPGTPGIEELMAEAEALRSKEARAFPGEETFTFRCIIEADSGMYDAINRGFKKGGGDILAWLNCDEQYLPGSLAKVAAFFEQNPRVDVLFGDALLIDNHGRLLSYRRAVLPNKNHIQLSHLNTLSCATFIRRRVLDQGLFLDISWKSIADAVWISEMIRQKLVMAVLPEPLAAFTITDKNLGQTSLGFREAERWRQQTQKGKEWLKSFFVLKHRLLKLWKGAYRPRNLSAKLYSLASPEQRQMTVAQGVLYKWPDNKAKGEGTEGL